MSQLTNCILGGAKQIVCALLGVLVAGCASFSTPEFKHP